MGTERKGAQHPHFSAHVYCGLLMVAQQLLSSCWVFFLLKIECFNKWPLSCLAWMSLKLMVRSQGHQGQPTAFFGPFLLLTVLISRVCVQVPKPNPHIWKHCYSNLVPSSSSRVASQTMCLCRCPHNHWHCPSVTHLWSVSPHSQTICCFSTPQEIQLRQRSALQLSSNLYDWTVSSEHVCFFVSSVLVGGAVVQRVRHLGLRLTDREFKSCSRWGCITTLGKLFTPMCLCHQAV